MKTNGVQQLLFQQIRALLPSNISFADDVADILGISIDSAYRRIRGEKPILLEEAEKLSLHYHISMDALIGATTNAVVFRGNWLSPEDFNFEQYLKNLLAFALQVNNGTNRMIFYEAKDFPPFHYFHYPELSAFKYFFWMKTILSYPECSKMKFEDNELIGPLHETGREIIKTYNKIPCAEIWSVETINSTIRQIEYYRETGVFNKPESIDLLYKQLSMMLDHIKDQAECGEKLMPGQKPCGGARFQLYFNEAYLGHNTILTITDDLQTVYINHGVLNLMATHDKEFCKNTQLYFDNTMKKSALISGVNDKERHRFFNNMQAKIEHAQQPSGDNKRNSMFPSL